MLLALVFRLLLLLAATSRRGGGILGNTCGFPETRPTIRHCAPDQQRRPAEWIFYLPMALAGVPPLIIRHRR